MADSVGADAVRSRTALGQELISAVRVVLDSGGDVLGVSRDRGLRWLWEW